MCVQCFVVHCIVQVVDVVMMRCGSKRMILHSLGCVCIFWGEGDD